MSYKRTEKGFKKTSHFPTKQINYKMMSAFHFLKIYRLPLLTALLLPAFFTAGCAKNVEKIEFTKWGNSFVTMEKGVTGMDTSAQGGAAINGQTPNSPSNKIPRVSVGGSYERGFATSPSYRMVGGFQVNPR